MLRTIICEFDNFDIADLSISKIRHQTPGISSVNFIAGGNEGDREFSSGYPGPVVSPGFMTIEFPAIAAISYTDVSAGTRRNAGQPVRAEISCSDDCHDRVVSQLINMGAQSIKSYD